MSAATVLAKMRQILGDQGESFQARVIGDGQASRFELPVEFIDSASFMAYTLDPTTTLVPAAGNVPNDYTLDPRAGTIILTTPLPGGKVLVTQGTHYQEHTPDDMLIYLQSAVNKHTYGLSPIPFLDPLPGDPVFSPAEQDLIAIRGVIEALWALATDASMDVNIQTPDGVSIPRAQRFQQIMQLIQYWEAEYQSIASMLNVGLNRIEMFDLRRVSRTTNRLVPLYRAREYDDRLPPQRVLVPIDNKGGRVITFKGTYLATTDYKRDDVVDLLQQRYLCKQPNGPATAVVTPGTNVAVWEVTTLNTGWAGGY